MKNFKTFFFENVGTGGEQSPMTPPGESEIGTGIEPPKEDLEAIENTPTMFPQNGDTVEFIDENGLVDSFTVLQNNKDDLYVIHPDTGVKTFLNIKDKKLSQLGDDPERPNAKIWRIS